MHIIVFLGPTLLIGLVVALAITVYVYWTLSSVVVDALLKR